MNVQLISVIMIVVLGSLGVIGHGLVLLLETNEREGLVAELNQKIAEYSKTTVPRMNGTTIKVDDFGDMTLEAEPLEFDGESSDVIPPIPTSYVWRRTVSRRHVFSGTVKVNSRSDAVAPYKYELPYIKLVSRSVFETQCEREFALDTCGVNPCCGEGTLTELCLKIAKSDNVNYTAFSGSDNCLVSHICGRCEWAGYVSQRCEMLEWHEGDWRMVPQDNNHSTGCRAPFTVADHTLTKDRPSDLRLTFRSWDDPYLWLQNKTFGTMKLGVASREQRKTALILIGAGVGVLLIGAGGVVAHTLNKKRIEQLEKEKNAKKRKKKKKKTGDLETGAESSGTEMQGLKIAAPLPGAPPPPPPGGPNAKGTRFAPGSLPAPPKGGPPKVNAYQAAYVPLGQSGSPKLVDMGGRRGRDIIASPSRVVSSPLTSSQSLHPSPGSKSAAVATRTSSLASFGQVSRTTSVGSSFSHAGSPLSAKSSVSAPRRAASSGRRFGDL